MTITFTITNNVSDKTITFTDTTSSWTVAVNSMYLYVYTSDKDNYLTKLSLSTSQIESLTNGSLTLDYADVFGDNYDNGVLLDDFYIVYFKINESEDTQAKSNVRAFGYTGGVASRVVNNISGIHVPVSDLTDSATLAMMPQILEVLDSISTDADYMYDRENEWRKLFNALNKTVYELEY